MATPCANTIEIWLLRLGHYLLHRPLPVAADWAWFVDLTMTIGSQKVLVIAGWGQWGSAPTPKNFAFSKFSGSLIRISSVSHPWLGICICGLRKRCRAPVTDAPN
jgi:hypothetical protein